MKCQWERLSLRRRGEKFFSKLSGIIGEKIQEFYIYQSTILPVNAIRLSICTHTIFLFQVIKLQQTTRVETLATSKNRKTLEIYEFMTTPTTKRTLSNSSSLFCRTHSKFPSCISCTIFLQLVSKKPKKEVSMFPPSDENETRNLCQVLLIIGHHPSASVQTFGRENIKIIWR